VVLLTFVKRARRHKLLESAYWSLAIVSEELGRDEQAIESYRQLIVAARSSAGSAQSDYWAKRIAELYAKNGRYEEAIAAYKQALELTSTVTEQCWIYADMASLYERVGDADQAVAACRKMVNLEPERPDWHLELGRLYLRLGRRKPALQEYEALKRLDQNMANKLLKEIQQH